MVTIHGPYRLRKRDPWVRGLLHVLRDAAHEQIRAYSTRSAEAPARLSMSLYHLMRDLIAQTETAPKPVTLPEALTGALARATLLVGLSGGSCWLRDNAQFREAVVARRRHEMALRLLAMVRRERNQRYPLVDQYTFYLEHDPRRPFFARITTNYDRQGKQDGGWWVEVILQQRNGYLNPATGAVDTETDPGGTFILDGYDFPTEVDAGLALFAWLSQHHTEVGLSVEQWAALQTRR